MTVVPSDFDEDGCRTSLWPAIPFRSWLFMNNHRGLSAEKGDLDLFKAHFIGDTNGFYRIDGKGNFDEGSFWQR
jgi:hypothetical protein